MRVALVVMTLVAAACTGDSSAPSTSTLPPPPSSVITERLLAELDLEGLAASTSRLRELEFLSPVPVQIVDDGDYRSRVSELAGLPGHSAVEDQWLSLLGALPEGFSTDLSARRLASSSVAFYDWQEGRVLVRASAGVDPYVESVVVHELVHALQQQHFGRPPDRPFDDAEYVFQALIEGDAQRVARRFIGELGQADEFAYEEGRLNALESTTAVRDSTPTYVVRRLTLPAADGVRFLQGVNYATVNGYFTDASSLPVSSEVLVDPNADTSTTEIELQPPTLTGYTLASRTTLGPGPLRLLLGEQQEREGTADVAARGWAGDELQVYTSDEDVVLIYQVAGGSAEAGRELASAFASFLNIGLPLDRYGVVRLADNQVLIVAASDPSLDETLDELYSSFGEALFRRPAG